MPNAPTVDDLLFRSYTGEQKRLAKSESAFMASRISAGPKYTNSNQITDPATLDQFRKQTRSRRQLSRVENPLQKNLQHTKTTNVCTNSRLFLLLLSCVNSVRKSGQKKIKKIPHNLQLMQALQSMCVPI